MEAPEETGSRVQRFIDDHKRRGLCIECNHPADSGRVRCSECSARRNRRRRERVEASVAEGRCRDCFRENALDGQWACRSCYLKRVSQAHFGTTRRSAELGALLDRQKGQCAYSGLCRVLRGRVCDDRRAGPSAQCASVARDPPALRGSTPRHDSQAGARLQTGRLIYEQPPHPHLWLMSPAPRQRLAKPVIWLVPPLR
jgi:hypothetical protein